MIAVGLGEHHPVPVRRCKRHLALAPGFVARGVQNDGSSADKFRMQRIQIVDLARA
jgi:hypothetical protein